MFADAAQVDVHRSNGCWTLTAPRRTLARPVVEGDRVYVLVDGCATALDRADGSVLWRSPHRVTGALDLWGMECTATGDHLVVPDGRLAPRNGKAGLSVLDAGSGALLWRSDAGPLAEFHADRHTLVTVHSDGNLPGRITALDLATGSRLWRREVLSMGSAVVTDGRLITYGSDDIGHRVLALDLRTGAELWRNTDYGGGLTLLRPDTTPDPSQIFVWSWPNGRMVRLALETGSETGRIEVARQKYHAQVLEDGRSVWLVGNGRRVQRFDVSSSANGPSHSFHPLRRGITNYRGVAVPGDGWLYGVDRARHLLAAPIDPGGRRPLPRLRWPRSVSLDARRTDYTGVLTVGPGQVYLTTPFARSPADRGVVAVRDGAVRWRLPLGHSSGRPVPAGAGVLLVDSPSDHDRLRMVDAGTGAFAGT
ncbi:PQQ-binding-like beta-propeller repeat protein [Kitasatospora sp. NPDC002040]|uniref:outer membrane protein assembly factor BamB family protein n=1 Tax=Kitasatospora sp. NPDC002040 TaxID=3154661 RepID=UPI003326C5DF